MFRLRVKIHVPYESLQTHVVRLHKLHQASDALRRTSRFVILARRLQAQMNEMNEKAEGDDRLATQNAEGINAAASTVAQGVDAEDEKERAIAKAALSIAELGTSCHCAHMCITIPYFLVVSLLEGTPDENSPAQAVEDDDVTPDISLRSIQVVVAYEPFIQDARARVTAEMENMVLTGLKTLVGQPLGRFILACVQNL